MIASKVSIGYFLLRITPRRLDVLIIWAVMIISVLTGVVFFFVTLFQCSPVSFFWNKDQNGSCINIDAIIALTYLYSVFNVICDFTFALLPVFLIMKLNMDRKTKIALIPIVLMACAYVDRFCPITNVDRLVLTRDSASSAVVVRFAYVKDFKNPDFLCKSTAVSVEKRRKLLKLIPVIY